MFTQRMFIFFNHDGLHRVLGARTIRFVDDPQDLNHVLYEKDCALATGDFANGHNIPTAYLVESYVKIGNDWILNNAYQAPLTREQVFENLYGQKTS